MELQLENQVQYLDQPEAFAQPAFLIHDQSGNVVECHFPDRFLKVVHPGYHNGVVTSPGGILEFLADGQVVFHLTPAGTTYDAPLACFHEVNQSRSLSLPNSGTWAEQNDTSDKVQPKCTNEVTPGSQPSTTGTQGFSIYATAGLSDYLFAYEVYHR